MKVPKDSTVGLFRHLPEPAGLGVAAAACWDGLVLSRQAGGRGEILFRRGRCSALHCRLERCCWASVWAHEGATPAHAAEGRWSLRSPSSPATTGTWKLLFPRGKQDPSLQGASPLDWKAECSREWPRVQSRLRILTFFGSWEAVPSLSRRPGGMLVCRSHASEPGFSGRGSGLHFLRLSENKHEH